MKHLFITLLALICATLHAQSVFVKGTGAGAVRGTIGQTPTSVLTNLAVTGTLNPDVTGTNYAQISDLEGYPRWYNSSIGYYIFYRGDFGWYFITPAASGAPSAPRWTNKTRFTPIGTYTQDDTYGSCGSTGTATVAYWYQTNYVYTVIVKGTATP